MYRLGNNQTSFSFPLHVPETTRAFSFLNQVGKTLLEILDFDEASETHLPYVSEYEDDLTSFKVSKLKKQRFKCLDLCSNEFVTLFVHEHLNLNCILTHSAPNRKMRIGLTILILDKFLENRPEFDKSCCHTLILLTAYRLACRSSNNYEELTVFLMNFPAINCSPKNFTKMLFGFVESIDGSLAFSSSKIESSYSKSKTHHIFSSLVYNFKSNLCTI